jgi:hypothetical protein
VVEKESFLAKVAKKPAKCLVLPARQVATCRVLPARQVATCRVLPARQVASFHVIPARVAAKYLAPPVRQAVRSLVFLAINVVILRVPIAMGKVIYPAISAKRRAGKHALIVVGLASLRTLNISMRV